MDVRALALAALLLGACGPPNPSPPDGGANSCGDTLPASCPSAAPSYAADVAPLVSSRCVACHGPGGVSSEKPLGSYPQLFQRRETTLVELHDCLMPPKAAAPLTASERHALERWLVCGAPDN